MSLAAETPVSSGNANGVTTTFAIGFTFEATADVKVVVQTGTAQAIKAEGVDYDIVAPSPTTLGGDVVFRGGHIPANGTKVICYRDSGTGQSDSFGDTGHFLPSMAERAADRLQRRGNESRAKLVRAQLVPVGETAPSTPATADRAGKLRIWANDGLSERTDRDIVTFDANVAQVATDAAQVAADRVATAGYKNQAQDYAAATAADAAQVAADRIATAGYKNQAQDYAAAAQAAAATVQPTDVRHFGVVADGVTDDTAALIAAMAASRAILIPAGVTLLLGKVTIPSNTVIWAHGAKLKLKNGTNDHLLAVASGASNILLFGGELDGNKANNGSGGCCFTTQGAGASNIVLVDVELHDAAGHNLQFNGVSVTNIMAKVRSHDATLAGATCNDTVDKFDIGGLFYNNGTHGCGAIGTAKNGRFWGEAWNNGPSADDFTGYNSNCENIHWGPIVSRGAQNNGVHGGGNNISYEVTIYGSAQHGVVHSGWDGAAYQVGSNVDIVATVYNAGNIGVLMERVHGGSVRATVKAAASQGVQAYLCQDVKLDAQAWTCVGDGIRGQDSTRLAIIPLANSGSASGVRLDSCTRCSTAGGQATLNSLYGYHESGTSANNWIDGTDLDGNGSASIGAMGAGSQFGDLRLDSNWSVASANTLTLLPGRRIVYVTGTTQINNITATYRGDRRTLVFDNTLTVKDGTGNLNLGADFAAAFTSTLSLVCDGTVWNKTGGAVN